MSALSVKDRAKMFGDLANSEKQDKSYNQIGNAKVSLSPFRSSTPTITKGVLFSPNTASFPNPDLPITPLHEDAPKARRKSLDWPVEDGIPVPDPSQEKVVPANIKSDILSGSNKLSNGSPPFRAIQNNEHLIKTKSSKTVREKALDVKNPPIKKPSARQLSNSSSPFKAVHNQEHIPKQSDFRTSVSSRKSNVSLGVKRSPLKKTSTSQSSNNSSPLKIVQNQAVNSSMQLLNGKTVNPSSFLQAKANKDTLANDNERKISTNDSLRGKSTRALRLMRAKRNGTSSPSPVRPKKKAPKVVVLRKETSDSGILDIDSRSSLTNNKKLCDITTRALEKSKDKIENDFTETKNTVSIQNSPRSFKSATKKAALDQNARRALLNMTATKKEGMIGVRESLGSGDASERLGVKASRAVAMKNSNRRKSTTTNLDIQRTTSLQSNESSRSRRVEHPAFAGRASPRENNPAANISSAHILASFRNFNSSRHKHPSHHQVANDSELKNDDDNIIINNSSGLESVDSLDQNETMHSLSERQAESMHSVSSRMHSVSGRNPLYHLGRLHVTSKNCNDTCVSSLSSNTNQSIMSQSIVSRMKSPMNKRNVQSTFLLDPTPEYSTQTMRSEMSVIQSPGPSNRSCHSIANSIISASPRSVDGSTSFGDHDDNSSLMDAFLETKSSHQESAGCSAELLDAALDAAVEDMDVTNKAKMTLKEDKKTINNDGTMNKQDFLTPGVSFLSSSSCRSRSPPGFVFDASDKINAVEDPPDQVEMVEQEEQYDPIISFGDGDTADRLLDEKLKHDILNTDTTEDFDEDNQKNIVANQKHGSNSTKQTVSTSIRSGMSSIQNGPIVYVANTDSALERINQDVLEGSTSIRTGLSGFQSQKDSNELEKSISIHADINDAFKNASPQILQESGVVKDSGTGTVLATAGVKDDYGTTHNCAQKVSVICSQIPDTIMEENEVKSTEKSLSSIKEREAASGQFPPNQLSMDSGGDKNSNYGGFNLKMSVNKNLLPSILTDGVECEEISNNGTSLLTPVSRSSRPWKENFGKIGNVIKNVLAKASPRAGFAVATTPSGFSKKCQDTEDSESLLFSLDDDDDDDIFGGLEEDEHTVEESKIVLNPKKKKATHKTPTQNNMMKYSEREESPHRNNESSTKEMNRRSGTRRSESDDRNFPTDGLPHMHSRTPSSPSAAAATNSASLYSNDRSGTVVDESEVVHNVNSDITSSLIGEQINVNGPFPFHNAISKASKLLREKINEIEPITPKSVSRSKSRSNAPKSNAFSDTKITEEEIENGTTVNNVCGNFLSTKIRATPTPKEEDVLEIHEDEEEEEEKQSSSMFLKFGCGFADSCNGFASFCAPASKVDHVVGDEGDDTVLEDDKGDETAIENGDGDKNYYASVSSHSRLTTLEKNVWNQWDRLNESVLSPRPNDTPSKVVDDRNDYHDSKREAPTADELCEVASTVLSSQMSEKSEKSVVIDDDQCTKNTITELSTVSTSRSSESGTTKNSDDSGTSRNYSCTDSGESSGSSSEFSNGYSTECSSSRLETDFISEGCSRSSETKTATTAAAATAIATAAVIAPPIAGPILLSFSQRSLMEKFSKQLTAVGVQVLKLNTRKQWQTRYFTVSNEQITLSAHESISKTGEEAQCPKALLWLKKFNPRMGGYGIINIDKNGHGGMLLVDLVDIQVSDRKDDMLGNPIPKKLMDKFKNSVLVTLKYKMSGYLRSIEFRCKDNDEAQFLCTCMRVIRDLLRRERSLRQKLNKRESNKNK